MMTTSMHSLPTWVESVPFYVFIKSKKNTLPFTGEYSSYRLAILSRHIVKWTKIKITVLAFITISFD